MRLKLTVEAGIALVVGPPRSGLRHRGVPPGGPFDRFAAAAANALVGNPREAPLLELAMARVRIEPEQGPPARFALVGHGHTASLSGRPVSFGGQVELAAGQALDLAPGAVGLRAYIALPGGVRVDGDTLHGAGVTPRRAAGRIDLPPLERPARLRVLGLSVARARARVGGRLDRVGVRFEPAPDLDGPRAEAETRPSVEGCLQRTPDGGLIAHGPEGPTLTGYPVVGFLATADLDVLAQLRPGDEAIFLRTTQEEARRAASEREARLDRLVRALALRWALG